MRPVASNDTSDTEQGVGLPEYYVLYVSLQRIYVLCAQPHAYIYKYDVI